MNIKDVKKKASEMDIDAGKMNKIDLIHAIQIEEGNFPCFQSDNVACEQVDCCWRGDCLPAGSQLACDCSDE
ncbi:MAG: Rho termination factor N-terminal domain-containing protein [Candidatus Electrothrix sp. YB6]